MIAVTLDDQLDRIRMDLVRRGLTYDRLMEDILDHVCCLLEEEMSLGYDFESSFDRVMDSIGDQQIPEIQHQTLLNLDKKFQRMKNFTYLFGLTSALLTILGAFFKKMHWPGAGILITLGIVLVVLVFLPLYFFTNQREQVEKKNPVYAIVGYLTLALLLASALFKIMHWPGANIMIQVGIGFLIIGFIPLYVVNAFQRGGKENIRLPYIVMLLVGISLVMLITNVRMSKYAIDLYIEEVGNKEHDIVEIEKRSARLVEMAQDSTYADRYDQVQRIHDQASGLQIIVDELKESLLQSVGQPGVSVEEVKGKDIRIKGWDFGMDLNSEKELVREALKFKEMLEEMLMDPVLRSQIDDHMEFTTKLWPYEFGARFGVGEPFIINYHMLTQISKGIALTEYVTIQYIMDH